jgi:hypothetical protein
MMRFRTPWTSVFFSAVVLLLVPYPAALAQPTDVAGCEWALQTATERYIGGAFADAVLLLEPCVQQPGLPVELRRSTFRLLILSHLRLGDRRAARRVLGELVRLDPAYEPDPVLDPPNYVAFITTELQDGAVPTQRGITGDAFPRSRWLLSMHLAAASYGGERGIQRRSLFGDFAANAGPSFGLALAAPVYQQLHLGARLQFHSMPSRFHHWNPPPRTDGPTPVHLIRDESSPWTMGLLVEGAWYFPPEGFVAPSVRLGLGGAFSHLNDRIRGGLIIQPGFDLSIPLERRWALLLNVDLGVVTPGDVLDLQNTSYIRSGTRGYDLITQIGIGLRYGNGSLRPGAY